MMLPFRFHSRVLPCAHPLKLVDLLVHASLRFFKYSITGKARDTV